MINLDKLFHFAAGAVLAIALGFFINAKLIIPVVLIVALLKEIFDARFPHVHTCDAMDFIATVVGGLTGVALL